MSPWNAEGPEGNGERGVAARWRGLALRWKVVIGAAGAFALLSALGDEEPSGLPPEVRVGAVLAGLQLEGEKPFYHEAGIEVVAVEGRWVQVQLDPTEASRRWFNFDHVVAVQRAHAP